MKVKLAEGRAVRDPTTNALMTEERDVPDNQFWQRRLRDGDVVLVEEHHEQHRRPQHEPAAHHPAARPTSGGDR